MSASPPHEYRPTPHPFDTPPDLCVQAQLAPEAGGLGGKSYVLTCGEGDFPSRRLRQIANRYKVRFGSVWFRFRIFLFFDARYELVLIFCFLKSPAEGQKGSLGSPCFHI